MSKPDLETRDYERRSYEYKKGLIRPKYDSPNNDGIRWYAAGCAVMLAERNIGLMVYPVAETAKPFDQANLSGMLKAIDYNDRQEGNEHLFNDLSRQILELLPPPLDSQYACIGMIIRRHNVVQGLKTILLGSGQSFGYYHLYKGRLFPIQFALGHEISLGKGEGLLVASPGIGKLVSPRIIGGLLQEKKYDPARSSFSWAQDAAEINKCTPLDENKEAVLAVRISTIHPNPDYLKI